MQHAANQFLAGVIEGFYGQPWNARQRHRLFTWMQAWGLNTYLYAPKDDLKHRARWRELYDDMQVAELAALIRDCQRHGLNFIHAFAPGLDLRYADAGELTALKNKFTQLLDLGCRDFALLFDDLPHRMNAADEQAFGSFARAQVHVANELFQLVRARNPAAKFFFCPTEYCARMAQPSVSQSAYLRELGDGLAPEIEVFWTGPEIVSGTISVESLHEVRAVLKRPPVLWDNQHANDYDMRRLYLGPYTGRPAEVRGEVRGILTNPNCQFEADFVAVRTLASYCAANVPWSPRKNYLQALAEWLPQFQSDGPDPLTLSDLELLGDLFYLPTEHGERAAEWLRDLETLLHTPPEKWDVTWTRFEGVSRAIVALFDKLSAMRNRDLLHALYKHAWEMKEEVLLVLAFLRWRKTGPPAGAKFSAPEFRPKVFRGGLTAELQRRLPMDAEGKFTVDPE